MITKSKSPVSCAANHDLFGDLVGRHGPILGGKDLFQALGYNNGQAFRQALRQDRLGVRVFNLPGRQGKFALTAEVADWVLTMSQADRSS